MSSAAHISTLYREFADLKGTFSRKIPLVWRVVADSQECACGQKHPDYSEHGYFLAVEMAFKQWEAMQNVGPPQSPPTARRAWT